MNKRITILDIPFDRLNEEEALKLFLERINSRHEKTLFAATPNPEMLLEAHRNIKFKELLNSTDINIADGIGILWAATYLSMIKPEYRKTKKIFLGIKTLLLIIINPAKIRSILPERVNGSTMMLKICEAIGPVPRVFLLGGAPGIADIVKKKLEKKYSVTVSATFAGSPDPKNDSGIIGLIKAGRPDILFIAYGSPKQELWIQRNLGELKTVRLVMGIGGAFDFIAGKKKRAPTFMQKIGLEWLFRLIQEPNRIKRIFNAAIKFPYMLIKSTLN